MPDVLTEVRNRRGPFTWVVIALVIAWWVLGVVRTVLAAVGDLPPLEAVARHAQDLVSVPVLLLLVLFAVADVWVRPRLANAARLTGQATWVSSLAVATSIAAGVAGLWSPLLRTSDRALEVADLVVSSVVPVLLCVALATVAGAARRARQEEASAVGSATGQGGDTVTSAPPPAGVPDDGTAGVVEAVPDEVSARWEPDETSGAVWHSAADAAHGREATSWGDATTPFGWEPAGPAEQTTPTEPPAADRKAPEPGRIDPDLWRTPGSDPR